VQDLDFEPDAFIEPDFDWSLTDTTPRQLKCRPQD